MRIQSVALSGLGAVGAMYAGKIMECFPLSLRIIADAERVRRYRRDGILINQQKCEFQYVDPEKGSPVDLVILAVKHHHLETAMREIRRFVGSDTLIISLLNGISSEEILGERFGKEKIIRAFVIGTDSVRVENTINYANTGEIVFGVESGGTQSARLADIQDFFTRAGIVSRIPEDILREQWWKFMVNAGLNQASAIMRAPYGVFNEYEEARIPMIAASREVIAIARKAGIDLRDDDIEKYLAVIKKLSPEGKTSMLQDIEAGRKTEVEIFSGAVTELGKKYAVATPVNDMMFYMIRAMERMQGEV